MCAIEPTWALQDISEYGEVQRVLREDIVNPLRKNQFVRADKVMKLRQFLDTLTSVKGLMSEEKGKFSIYYSKVKAFRLIMKLSEPNISHIF